MGQVASLHSVPIARFQRLADTAAPFVYAVDVEESVYFDQTFQGLTYTLAKACDNTAAPGLMEHLFESTEFLGEDFDLAKVDWDSDADLDHYMALEEARIYYHSPDKVQAIAACLATVTDEAFLAAFDPADMNRQGVYPGVWNRNTGPDEAFNEQNTLQEFHFLRDFFARISSGAYYCVCYVG
ncbi:DUF1877 family protein [Hymenobacter metallicola]|uniref:DUF1877 family protein n=1 Tax=Hymenobacter metallicola TaxID=2563114 RepID=A0A4Z0QED0_9BACT|nr:DUF1877 family protein [Hymenobacter metallicola]TGE28054.1 DUF1877 family protein [Hymenobacter metallicola]